MPQQERHYRLHLTHIKLHETIEYEPIIVIQKGWVSCSIANKITTSKKKKFFFGFILEISYQLNFVLFEDQLGQQEKLCIEFDLYTFRATKKIRKR